MRFHPYFAATILTLTSCVFGQQPATAPSAPTKDSTITVDAKLVIVPAIVRDKHDALVSGLTRDNFVLEVDGKPQAIRYFDHDADVPLTLGLLIDTSMSQRNVLDDERSASASFLDKMLAPDRDQAFLIQFARTVTLLQDVTTSRGKLQQALKQVDAAQPSFQSTANGDTNGGDPNDSRGGGHRGHTGGGGTALYDSVFLAADEVLSKQKGRRALVLLTDGDDRGSLKNLPQAIESAQRADTIVYAIYYKDDHPNNGGGGGPFGGGGMGHHGGMGGPGGGGHGGYGQQHVDGKKVLERICGETGGRVFEVSKKETVEKIYSEIGEELRSQYRLGFSPTEDAASEGYHLIALSLSGAAAKGKNAVQARDGYYRQ